jgi:hypothetical protein
MNNSQNQGPINMSKGMGYQHAETRLHNENYTFNFPDRRLHSEFTFLLAARGFLDIHPSLMNRSIYS